MNEDISYDTTEKTIISPEIQPKASTTIPTATGMESLTTDAADGTLKNQADYETLKPQAATSTLHTIVGGSPYDGSADMARQIEGHPSSFNLKGKRYATLECISDTSGEAQVYLVDDGAKKYVLKLYYPKFHINKDLLKIIINHHFDMVVKIYDFGKTYADGKRRDYELMEYLQGGTLSKYNVRGDINKFRRIALQAAASLAFCHNYNIIHKDIKPSNFFFRDEEKTQIVLGDFGISSIEDGDSQYHSTTQARTPTYAAPEMYNNVIDGKVEITPAVDYFSLGITLMTIWTGHTPYGSNERLMMKMKNEGKLPGLDELPERVRILVEGLATSNPQSRWTYEQVEEWFKGESPKVDHSSPFLNYKNFIFDPERNLIAESIHDLVPMLLDNERIACSYLYEGKIVEWLEHCGNSKLAVMVSEVVKRYPTDKQAGLMAAVYLMEPTYPYHDIHGSPVDDIHGVVASMLRYNEEYSVVLRNPNNRLWLYVESHTKCNVDRLRSYFGSKPSQRDPWAVVKACYELDSELPFFPDYPSSTITEIVRSFGDDNMPEENWKSIVDGRLLSWMLVHAEPMACESLRLMIEGKQYSKTLAYKVLYDIDRTAPYDLVKADTPDSLGEWLSQKLMEWQSFDDKQFSEAMKDFTDPDGRFSYYAQLHGWYEEADEAGRCFDLDSSENRERLGVYNLRMAAYRFCRVLGYLPSYRLSDTVVLTSGDQIDAHKGSDLKRELANGCLAQWLAAYYHEDPTRDFSQQYSYERALAEWLEKLGSVDKSNVYYRRYEQAKGETRKKFEGTVRNYRLMSIQSLSWQVLFYGLAAAWIAMLLIFGVGDHQSIVNHSLYTIGIPVGVLSGALLGMRTYFRGSDTTIIGLWVIVGILSSLIPIQILRFVENNSPSAFVAAIVVISLVYIAICHFSNRRRAAEDHAKVLKDVLSDDVKTQLIEPLYYAFKTKSRSYKGVKFSLVDEIEDQFVADSTYRIAHFVLWSIMLILLLAELILYSPQLLNHSLPSFVGGA